MSDKDPKQAREEIIRDDINRTLRRAGREQTRTDREHTEDLKKGGAADRNAKRGESRRGK